jgi:beta-lactamase superfamily II metal-dependent hydrolase
MPAEILFFPLGNADTTLVRLADKRRVLFDFADVGKSENSDITMDLAGEIRNDLRSAGQNSLAVLCITHLDEDHCFGFGDAFSLRSDASRQGEGRIRFDEMWVPAAAITETNLETECAKLVQKEARHRLLAGQGIKVFSGPKALDTWLRQNGQSLESRASCILHAGDTVPGFAVTGPESVEFFIHCPLTWVQDEDGEVVRNEHSIVLQASFVEGGRTTKMLLGSDVDSNTLSEIVESTLRHGNANRLEWDVLKLFHHCSYKALNRDDRGTEKTKPVEEVAWLIERQGQPRSKIVSPSEPIPARGAPEDNDQPPHRQAAAYYRDVQASRNGQFLVTMEDSPKRALGLSIGAAGVAQILATPATAGSGITSKPTRAG